MTCSHKKKYNISTRIGYLELHMHSILVCARRLLFYYRRMRAYFLIYHGREYNVVFTCSSVTRSCLSLSNVCFGNASSYTGPCKKGKKDDVASYWRVSRCTHFVSDVWWQAVACGAHTCLHAANTCSHKKKKEHIFWLCGVYPSYS